MPARRVFTIFVLGLSSPREIEKGFFYLLLAAAAEREIASSRSQGTFFLSFSSFSIFLVAVSVGLNPLGDVDERRGSRRRGGEKKSEQFPPAFCSGFKGAASRTCIFFFSSLSLFSERELKKFVIV